jgi:sporulation protein YlmC with PRC-barrel domain
MSFVFVDIFEGQGISCIPWRFVRSLGEIIVIVKVRREEKRI